MNPPKHTRDRSFSIDDFRSAQAALTERRGPLWHVLVARDSVEMGTAVAAHAGSFLDARVLGRGGAHRVVIWQHDLPLRYVATWRA